MAGTPRRVGAEPDWRLAAHPDDLREYDAFGPWIDPVRSETDLPRRFRRYWAEHRDARFLLKLPRGEDRADLRPGMDLYEAVLAVHSDGICLLRLVDGEVITREAAWDRIVATRLDVQLLDATWSLLLDDGSSIDLDHNSASAGGLARAVEYVQARLTTEPVPGWRAELPPVAVSDGLFNTRLAQLQRSATPPVSAIHCERRNHLCRDERNRPRLSTGLVLADTAAEFVLISRGEPMSSRFLPNHGSSVTRVPYQRLTSYGLLPPGAGHRSFHLLELRAGEQRIQQWCLNRPDAAVDALDGRGVPRSDLAAVGAGLR